MPDSCQPDNVMEPRCNTCPAPDKYRCPTTDDAEGSDDPVINGSGRRRRGAGCANRERLGNQLGRPNFI
jgi:hypothetical protein